jgi:selenide,water dikinase
MSEGSAVTAHQPITRMASCGGCAAKVGAGDLRAIMQYLGAERGAAGPGTPDLLVGTETGDDAAVYRLQDDLALVLTTDFITPLCDDPFLYGQVAAANAVSDVFAMGGTPLLGIAVCGFPEALAPEVAREICAGGAAKTAEAGAVVAGGHTIRNTDLFYGLAVAGRVHPERVMRNRGARAGDALVLTKPLGSGLIVNGARSGKLDEATLLDTCRTIAQLNRTPAELMASFGAHAATDVTGFGLAGHALGMARATGLSFRISLARLPIFAVAPALAAAGVTTRGTRQNRETFSPELTFVAGATDTERAPLVFDPQTSGGLLIALDADRAPAFVEELHRRGVPAAAVIGQVAARAPGATALEFQP